MVSWIEAKESFLADQEIKSAFGGLFRGLETDPDMAAGLYEWYQQSKTRLATCPGLSDKVDLTSIGADRLAELASKAETIRADAETLSGAEAAVRDVFGADMAGFHDAMGKGWDSAIGVLEKALESLGTVTGFFSARADSRLAPREALRLMEAKADLSEAGGALSALLDGETAIRRAGGDELGALATIAGGPWDGALKEISEKVTHHIRRELGRRSVCRAFQQHAHSHTSFLNDPSMPTGRIRRPQGSRIDFFLIMHLAHTLSTSA